MRKLRSRVNQLRGKVTLLTNSTKPPKSSIMKSLSNWHLYSYNDFEINRLVRSPWADYFTDIFSRAIRLFVSDISYRVTNVAVPRFYFNSNALTGSLFASVKHKYSGEEHDFVEPVFVQNVFDPLETQMLQIDEQNVTTIVPVSGRSNALAKFLNNWTKLAKFDDKLFLIISIMDTKLDVIKRTEDIISGHNHSRIKVTKQVAQFSRGPALQVALKQSKIEGLYFFCDVGTG